MISKKMMSPTVLQRTITTLLSFAWILQSSTTTACYVDPLSSFTSTLTPNFLTVDLALAGGCSAPGSVITIVCPPPPASSTAGCVTDPFRIDTLTDITVQSAETALSSTTYAPVRVELISTTSSIPYGILIRKSQNIVISGLSRVMGTNFGIVIKKSQGVEIRGRPTLGQYTDVSGSKNGIQITSKSVVLLFYISITESKIGLRITEAAGASPFVHAAALAVLYCKLAIYVGGRGVPTPHLMLHSDFTSVTGITDMSQHIVHNYIMQNDEGIHMKGDAKVEVEHTIFAGNLRYAAMAARPAVLKAMEDSELVLRNCLFYDNDAYPNPGKQVEWSGCTSGCINTPGRILHHETSLRVSIDASSFIDNQCDLIFHLENTATSSGMLWMNHNVIAHSWGKVFSLSSWSACPPIDNINKSNFLWDNAVDVDPPSCNAIYTFDLSWDPNPAVMAPGYAKDTVPFPNIIGPFEALYLIGIKNPTTTEIIPPMLYQDFDWTVDGVTLDDVAPLDVGYHNPIIGTSSPSSNPSPVPSTTPTTSSIPTPVVASAFCSDDTTWIEKKTNKTCGWISNDPVKRCNKTKYMSVSGKTPKEACPIACNTAAMGKCIIPTCNDKTGWKWKGTKNCKKFFKKFTAAKCAKLGKDSVGDDMFAYETCSACSKCLP